VYTWSLSVQVAEHSSYELFQRIVRIFQAEARLNSMQEFSLYLKENTRIYRYKYQLVNTVYGNNSCFHSESYKTNQPTN